MRSPDLQLLLRTHTGHEPSAERLWARFSPCMLAYARSIVRDGDAADVVQGVFLVMMQLPRRRLRRVQDVRAWFLHLTRNAALNHLRARRREAARLQRPLPEAGAGEVLPPEDLRAALDALPRRDRELIILKHIAGLTFDQIALALGANRNTAASRYRAALARLRDLCRDEALIPGGTP